MHLVVQTLVLGLLIGGIYALLAVGLSLIFGVMRVVNFAHGAIYMLGGFGAYYASESVGLPFVVGLLAALAVGAAVGSLIDALLLRPVHSVRVDRPGEYTLIVTFALTLLLTASAIALFGAEFRGVSGFWNRNLRLGDWINVSGDRVVAFGIAVLLTALLFWVVYRTDVGRGWRAMTQSRTGARVVGIDIVRLSNLAWATAGALAATAGALLAPLYSVYPGSGNLALVKGFVVVVIGGLGSVGGSLVAGLLLGLVEAFGSTYIESAYRDAYGFALMIAILLFWPQGLFGRQVRAL